MFNMNHAIGKSLRLLLLALVTISLGCSRKGENIEVALARYQHLGQRIDIAAESIARAMSAARQSLSTGHLEFKKNVLVSKEADVADQTITFRVEGVVMNDREPLVMTSHGVAGLGGEVDGFKVVGVQADGVTFADRQGHTMKVPLYKEESAP
jgi:hypothetical protein